MISFLFSGYEVSFCLTIRSSFSKVLILQNWARFSVVDIRDWMLALPLCDRIQSNFDVRVHSLILPIAELLLFSEKR